ncbi:hypothetical protein [Arthrobacter sp. Leaf337]|uniref:hypothetical protein n=1 Tax=Arthrobacter sp. Leaf337 TaxID=1736342 RepID=UPI0012E18B88|nr:hypothetical protein [Arthrobacter sp. Leaf337]
MTTDNAAAEHEPSDQGSSNDDAVSRSEISQAPEDILAYWTPERLADAKPREVRLPQPEADHEPDGD